MQFTCRAARSQPGQWTVRYEGTDLGPLEVTAPTREQAMEKMQGELRYRLELCPCTGEAYRDIKIELQELPNDGAG